MRKKTVGYAFLFILLLTGIVFGFGSTVQELRQANFQITGQAVDADTGEPIPGAWVLLLLQDPATMDPEELDGRFRMNHILFGQEKSDLPLGVSNANGEFIARVQAKYEVRYPWMFGLGRALFAPSHPFHEAYVLYNHPNYTPYTQRLIAKDWTFAGWEWEKTTQHLPPTKLMKRR